MTMITPFKAHTLALFKAAPAMPQLSLPVKPAALPAKPVVPSPQLASVAVTPANPTGVEEPSPEEKAFRESIAKSEAAMAVWEAGEQKFEQENGFRRLVNSMALGSYAQAKSGNFGAPSFGTADEAAEYLGYLVGRMGSNVDRVQFAVGNTEYLARPEVAAARGEVATGQLRAKFADEKLASEMDLYVLNAVLTRAFGTSGALYAQDSTGRISFVAQDVTFEGKPLARLSADGFLTRLAPDGTPLTPPETPPAGIDRRI